MASVASVQLQSVTTRFGSVEAVRSLDLEIERGEFFTLLGPSGCGKTTTLRIVAGFEQPTSGRVLIDGVDVEGRPPFRRPTNTVFQSYALFPHLNVEDNVAFGLKRTRVARDEIRARVGEELERVGLAAEAKRKPRQLSGGQQQRVALARALAPEPEVVLLDEPFSNLDAALRTRVRMEMREILTNAGATAVFVTHDQEEALSLADEVAVMMGGTIAQKAAPEDLYHNPATPEVARFVGEANFLRGTAREGCVRCALGEIPAYCPYNGEVEAMLRPEALRLIASPDGDGTVVGREFYGHDQLLKIQLSCGDVLHSRLGAGPGLQVGDRVRVEVAGPAVAFPKADASL